VLAYGPRNVSQGNEGLKTVGDKAIKDYCKSSCGSIDGNPM